jgi:co-chaperonin GroES (HSP10)
MEPLTYQGNVYAYLFTLDGDGPYSVTLVTKSATPPFDGGSGTELDPYLIGSAASFTELQTKIAAGDTFSGKFFKLSANVDFATLGLNPFAGVGFYDTANPPQHVPFCGTFDGDNKTISNVVFTKRTYAGFFNVVSNGTIKNLIIDGVSFTTATAEGDPSSWGGAAFVGFAQGGSTLENLTAQNTAVGAPAFAGNGHNMAGIAVKIDGSEALYCTNKMAITCSYTKVGGISAFTQQAAATYIGCSNEGDLYATSDAVGMNADNGIGGIVGWVANPVTLIDCSNTGDLVITGTAGYKYGTLAASAKNTTVYATNCTASASMIPVTLYGGGTSPDLTFATVDNGVATFVPAGELVKDTQYKAMLDVGETTVFTLAAVNDWIAFDTNLVSFAGEVDLDPELGVGVKIETSEESGIVTFTAVPFGSPTPEISPGDDAVVVSAESADEATNKVELVIEDQAAEAAGQAAVVKLVATPVLGQENKWSVSVAIDTNAVGFVDADVTVADVATNLATVAVAVGSTVSITIPAADVTPGLYYSVAMVTDLATADAAAWAAGEGARALAGASHGADLTLVVPKPTSGTKAFYKVLVNMVGNTPAPPPNND